MKWLFIEVLKLQQSTFISLLLCSSRCAADLYLNILFKYLNISIFEMFNASLFKKINTFKSNLKKSGTLIDKATRANHSATHAVYLLYLCCH